MLQVVMAHRHQLHHDESREDDNEEDIELKLGVLEEILDIQLDDCCIEQSEIDARKEGEQCTDVLQGRGVEKLRTRIVSGETTCGSGRHRIVETVEDIHATEIIAHDASYGEYDVDTPYPLGTGGKARMQLGLDRTSRLGGKHLDLSSHKRWQQGDGEEHDTQSTYPLRQRTPEKQSMWQHLHIIYNSGSRGRESRHRLKVGIRETMDVSTDQEWERAKETEDNPCQ